MGKKPILIRIRGILGNPKGQLIQGGASEWRVHSTLIFENLKLIEISKKKFQYHLNIFKSCIDFQN